MAYEGKPLRNLASIPLRVILKTCNWKAFLCKFFKSLNYVYYVRVYVYLKFKKFRSCHIYKWNILTQDITKMLYNILKPVFVNKIITFCEWRYRFFRNIFSPGITLFTINLEVKESEDFCFFSGKNWESRNITVKTDFYLSHSLILLRATFCLISKTAFIINAYNFQIILLFYNQVTYFSFVRKNSAFSVECIKVAILMWFYSVC